MPSQKRQHDSTCEPEQNKRIHEYPNVQTWQSTFDNSSNEEILKALIELGEDLPERYYEIKDIIPLQYYAVEVLAQRGTTSDEFRELCHIVTLEGLAPNFGIGLLHAMMEHSLTTRDYKGIIVDLLRRLLHICHEEEERHIEATNMFLLINHPDFRGFFYAQYFYLHDFFAWTSREIVWLSRTMIPRLIFYRDDESDIDTFITFFKNFRASDIYSRKSLIRFLDIPFREQDSLHGLLKLNEVELMRECKTDKRFCDELYKYCGDFRRLVGESEDREVFDRLKRLGYTDADYSPNYSKSIFPEGEAYDYRLNDSAPKSDYQ